MPSTIRGDDNFDSAYGAALKAWVNFNGEGAVSIRTALNVTSITDIGTGDYRVNMTTALPDADYAVSITAGAGVVSGHIAASDGSQYEAKTTTTFKIRTLITNTGNLGDSPHVSACVFR